MPHMSDTHQWVAQISGEPPPPPGIPWLAIAGVIAFGVIAGGYVIWK